MLLYLFLDSEEFRPASQQAFSAGMAMQCNAQMLLNPLANSATSPLQPGSCTDRNENCYIPLKTCPSRLEIGFKTGDRLMNRKLS